MARRLMTFSRVFPTYHPRKGEPTYFVEKIFASIMTRSPSVLHDPLYKYWDDLLWQRKIIDLNVLKTCEPKLHTIRAGNRWAPGDIIIPKIWSGAPYRSKQIQFAPEIEVKKVFKFNIIHLQLQSTTVYINDRIFTDINRLAANDGLSYKDMEAWFKVHPKTKSFQFTGQIICWDDSINY